MLDKIKNHFFSEAIHTRVDLTTANQFSRNHQKDIFAYHFFFFYYFRNLSFFSSTKIINCDERFLSSLFLAPISIIFLLFLFFYCVVNFFCNNLPFFIPSLFLVNFSLFQHFQSNIFILIMVAQLEVYFSPSNDL